MLVTDFLICFNTCGYVFLVVLRFLLIAVSTISVPHSTPPWPSPRSNRRCRCAVQPSLRPHPLHLLRLRPARSLLRRLSRGHKRKPCTIHRVHCTSGTLDAASASSETPTSALPHPYPIATPTSYPTPAPSRATERVNVPQPRCVDACGIAPTATNRSPESVNDSAFTEWLPPLPTGKPDNMVRSRLKHRPVRLPIVNCPGSAMGFIMTTAPLRHAAGFDRAMRSARQKLSVDTETYGRTASPCAGLNAMPSIDRATARRYRS